MNGSGDIDVIWLGEIFLIDIAVKATTTPVAETSNSFKGERPQNVVHHQEPSQQPLDLGVVIDRNSLKLAENVLQEVAELQPQQPG